MENSQISILTALFGGKPAGGALPGGKTLFAVPPERADKDAQGFFSFLEGLLKTQPEQDAEAIPLGAPSALESPAFEVVRERLKTPSEPVITIGGAETLGAPLLDAHAAAAAPVEAKLSGVAAAVTVAVPAEEAPQSIQETLSIARTSSAGVDTAQVETAAAGRSASDAHKQVMKTGEDFLAKPAPSAQLAKYTPEAAAAAIETPMDFDPQGFEMSSESPRDKTDNMPGVLIASRPGVKPAPFPAGAQANGAAAIGEQAAPQAFEHAALTREEGGLDFERLASSRFDAVSAAAHRTVHVHAVRDQIAAAVTARQGDGKLEIRLDPPELGRVTIGFESDGADIVRVVIAASAPETLDLMRRHADVFQRALEDQGFEGLDLQFTDRGPQENPADEAGGKPYAFGLAEEETAALAAATAPAAALGRLDRRL